MDLQARASDCQFQVRAWGHPVDFHGLGSCSGPLFATNKSVRSSRFQSRLAVESSGTWKLKTQCALPAQWWIQDPLPTPTRSTELGIHVFCLGVPDVCSDVRDPTWNLLMGRTGMN
jgi:hypothetical protein